MKKLRVLALKGLLYVFLFIAYDLIVNILEKAVGISLIFALMRFGTMWLAIGALITYFVATIANSIVCGKLIHYTFIEQIKDVIPYFLITLIACAPSWAMNYINLNLFLKMTVQILLAVALYVLISYLTKAEPFWYLIKTLKGYKK